jgi:N4-gp56 family major capsid protein
MYSLNLSKKLRTVLQPMCKFRQFCDTKDASQQGLHKGDTYHWNVYSNVATQGGTLVETNTMPETQFTITQGTLTITEFGNSVPYTAKLDNLSEHPVKQIIDKVLKHDASKAFDTAAHAEFAKSYLTVYPATGTTITLGSASSYGGSATGAMAKTHVGLIADAMKERNIPGYVGDDYYCLAHPTTLSTVKGDLDSVHQYVTEGFRLIANGEMGRYRGVRFVEQTNIAKDSTTNTDWAFFFGADTVAEAIAVPEEMRGKIPSDYGRSKGVAWYYLGGFGLVHGGASGTVDQARIMRWGSTA